jgi:hypothetical protein
MRAGAFNAEETTREEDDMPLATVPPRAEQGGDDAAAGEGVSGAGDGSRGSTRHQGG